MAPNSGQDRLKKRSKWKDQQNQHAQSTSKTEQIITILVQRNNFFLCIRTRFKGYW